MQLLELLVQKRQLLQEQGLLDSIKFSYFFFIKRNLKYSTSAEENYAVLSGSPGRQKASK